MKHKRQDLEFPKGNEPRILLVSLTGKTAAIQIQTNTGCIFNTKITKSAARLLVNWSKP